MINKIIASYLLFACFVAIALKLGGVDNTIHLGNYFRAYLVESNRQLSEFKIAIPDIPHIPLIEVVDNQFLSVVNGVVMFLNGLVDILNFLVMAINTIIQVIELIFIFLKNLIIMKDDIISA